MLLITFVTQLHLILLHSSAPRRVARVLPCKPGGLMVGRACASVRSECEMKLEGQGPWAVPGGEDDLEIIHTPGHT